MAKEKMFYLVRSTSFASRFWRTPLTTWFKPMVFFFAGSMIIFWLDPVAGLSTFLLSLTALLIASLVARVEMQKCGEQISAYESALTDKFSALLSSQMEAQIFNYAKKIEDELKEIDKDLRSMEKRSLFFSGMVQGFTYLLLGINILLNLFFSIMRSESETLSIIQVSALILLPFLIYSSIATLPAVLRK
jgi:ABC-type transport system involved in cytochrome bd biosynthesis fused ATPase/permease subunit